MWLNLLGLGIKTGAKIYANNKATKVLESEAKRKHYEKMASGEIEYKGQILNSQDKDLKTNLYLYLSVCLSFYWVILFSLTLLTFVNE